MSLFDDAAADFREIINSDIGASLECVITSPDGVINSFKCRMSDISQSIEPGTGDRVSGRRVSISMSLFDLKHEGFESVRGIEKKNEKPWKVEFNNILCDQGTFKVTETAPDYTLGVIVLHLELMK